MFQKLIHTDDDVSSAILRWTLAIVFFPHGAQKVLGWWGGGGFSATMSYFTGDGMPWIIACLVVLGEFLGPIGLAAGFLSRFAAFGLAVIMLGAVFMVHGAHGFFMNWYGAQGGEGFEYHLLAIGLSVAVMLRGSGAFSIDRQLSR